MPLSPASAIGGGGGGGAVTQGTVPWVIQEPLEVEGNVAAGAADSGNPVKGGGRAADPFNVGMPAPVLLDDRVDATFSLYGALGTFLTNSEASIVNVADDSLFVGGPRAADAPVAGQPILVGTRADDGTPGAVSADGDVVRLWARRTGALVVDGPLTDAELRAAVVPVGDGGGSLTVDGPLTDAELRAAVVPVRETVTAMTWASVKSAAPAANAVQATTGALSADDYDFDIFLAVADTVAVGKGLVVEHRNAADNATLFNLGGATPNGGAVVIPIRNYTIAANERIRVIAGTAAGAANSMYVSAIGRRAS